MSYQWPRRSLIVAIVTVFVAVFSACPSGLAANEKHAARAATSERLDGHDYRLWGRGPEVEKLCDSLILVHALPPAKAPCNAMTWR